MACVVVSLKPDALDRNLDDEILETYNHAFGGYTNERWFRRGHHNLVDLLSRHYAEHKGKEFLYGLVSEMAIGPIYAYRYDKPESMDPDVFVNRARKITMQLRDKHAVSKRHNTVHCSDSIEAGHYEKDVWDLAE
jgi:nucleoside diphosphate kinase